MILSNWFFMIWSRKALQRYKIKISWVIKIKSITAHAYMYVIFFTCSEYTLSHNVWKVWSQPALVRIYYGLCLQHVPFSIGKLMSLLHVATNAEHVSLNRIYACGGYGTWAYSQIIHHISRWIFHLPLFLRALTSPFSLWCTLSLRCKKKIFMDEKLR